MIEMCIAILVPLNCFHGLLLKLFIRVVALGMISTYGDS